MKVLIASGGTGGHFYPGYALGVELKKRGWQVLFLLKENDPAQKFLDERSMPSAQIGLTGMPRTANPLKLIFFAAKLFSSLLLTRRIINDWRPNFVIGMGGYTSFPAILCAWLYKIPSLIHESNAKLGLANKISAYFADTLALGLPIKNLRRPKKIILTGTPVREDFSQNIPQTEARKKLNIPQDKKVIFVFGGSQGARALNFALANIFKQSGGDIFILHVSGRRDYGELLKFYGQAQNIKLVEYCDCMNLAYRACDLVISRSGASTIAELIAVQKPAILVPFPSAAANHQLENALVLKRAGCAEIIEEGKNFEQNLTSALTALTSNPARLSQMQSAYKTSELPNPFQAIKNLLF
ncbi:MAG: undecaprenyldiphospho-muramoylpentapeptide beta-N-acetylglucosaminyltransferase [Elusimicrobia bacterium]|nr:undecaprenyldiphospho-muramoylpentapeptide beta-N-acetylglucosaminyltransferase [Elusimicrobiota bacterium]